MPITRNYSAGSIVYFGGDIGEDIYVMQKGRISLISTSLDQKEDIKEDVRKGEFFGVKSALGRYPREETAQVLADSQVLVFKTAEFEQFAQKNTRIVLQMLKVFSSQLRRVHKAVREFLGEHGASESSTELVRVGEYYYKAGKTDYALYVFTAYLKHHPTGKLGERVRRLAQMVKEGAPYPIDMQEIEDELQTAGAPSAQPPMQQQSYNSDTDDYTPQMDDNAMPDLPDFDGASDGGAASDLALPEGGDFDLPMPDDFDMPQSRTAADAFNAGLSAFATQRFDEALASYEEALSLNGGSDAALHEKTLYELGRTQVKKNNAKGAVEKFSELMRTYPQGALVRKAMIQTAEIYERAKDSARAAALYEKAARIGPQDKEANIAQQKANQLKGIK